MDTPDKNRISAVSFCNFEDSPVFQYINDLSPIEPVKPARPENIFHSLAFTSPSSIFSSPQLNSYRDSRFSIKRHRSLDLSSPVVLIDEDVKNSPAALEAVDRSGVCEKQPTCRPEQVANASEIKPFKKQISLAIELADSLKQGRDGCGIQMVSCDEVSMDVEKKIGRSDSQGVHKINEMEAEIGSGGEIIMFDVAGIQNSEQQNPRSTVSKFSYFACEPQQFPLCCQSRDVEEPGGSCSVQLAEGAPEITVSSLSKVVAIESNGKAEDKEDTGLHPSRKQRSIRRRCLTFDVGGSYKRIPLRESTNDLPLNFASISEAPTPEKCLGTSKKDTYEIPSIPQKIGLHLNGLVNPSSVSNDQNKLKIKDGQVFPHGPTKFHLNTEDEFSTPVSTKRDLVSCDIENMEAPQISMEGECFDNHMATDNTQLSQGLDELSSCKRCKCRKSKCLKLYCDCFAAGLYCDGPCSCQNCFNKPKYEDVVIKTRQLIEARNPLAFAPKVVSTCDSAIEFWDENNKTPASARHKSGCNCKKSGCLKKYCECFMMGVGCSSSCRCMGCKNVYGHANEQCMGESDSVTILEKALDNGEHVNASSCSEHEEILLQ